MNAPHAGPEDSMQKETLPFQEADNTLMPAVDEAIDNAARLQAMNSKSGFPYLAA